jgi:hypothetical protein
LSHCHWTSPATDSEKAPDAEWTGGQTRHSDVIVTTIPENRSQWRESKNSKIMAQPISDASHCD